MLSWIVLKGTILLFEIKIGLYTLKFLWRLSSVVKFSCEWFCQDFSCFYHCTSASLRDIFYTYNKYVIVIVDFHQAGGPYIIQHFTPQNKHIYSSHYLMTSLYKNQCHTHQYSHLRFLFLQGHMHVTSHQK